MPLLIFEQDDVLRLPLVVRAHDPLALPHVAGALQAVRAARLRAAEALISFCAYGIIVVVCDTAGRRAIQPAIIRDTAVRGSAAKGGRVGWGEGEGGASVTMRIGMHHRRKGRREGPGHKASFGGIP